MNGVPAPGGSNRGRGARPWWRPLVVGVSATALVVSACSAPSAALGGGSAAPGGPVTAPGSAVPGVGPTRASSRTVAPTAVRVSVLAVGQVISRRADGAVVERVSIPSSGGFRPTRAYLYVPSAALHHPDRRLPVLELLHGTPGQPVDWINGANVIAILDAFAAAHHGQAPLVVMPDINGAHRADSECIRTAAGGNVERYLTHDVVGWVRAHFAATVVHERWWIAGLSEGGLCSAMLALRHPHLYDAFGDFSGAAVPAVEGLSAAASARQLYAGDPAAAPRYEPLLLLARHRYPGLRGWFEAGAHDRSVLAAQTRMTAAARAAGLTVRVLVRPGGHAWAVWASALRGVLPWLWRRQ